MRKSFSEEIERLANEDPNMVFITGDLGFNAFENLQKSMGDRFINAGVAEQHMIGLAAGMASEGRQVFVYSIAPFIVYRALEQVRNDICFHQLPVCLVGNGGGYGYGIMGSSHHALSDVGILSSLPNMNVYVPAFDNEVSIHLKQIVLKQEPSYLRLGYAPAQEGSNNFNAVNLLNKADKPLLTLCLMGPIVHSLMEHSDWQKFKAFVDVFSMQHFPIKSIPEKLRESLSKSKSLFTAEEHYANAGLGQQLSMLILEEGIRLDSFKSHTAVGYPNQKYGCQAFHQVQSKIDAQSLIDTIQKLLGK